EAEEQKKTEKIVHALLLNLFGNVKYGEDGRLVISVDDNVAYLDKQKGEVESESEALKERVRLAFKRIQTAVKPIPVSGRNQSKFRIIEATISRIVLEVSDSPRHVVLPDPNGKYSESLPL
nr:hypothetical protein [Tanacetum cinerariifolium]